MIHALTAHRRFHLGPFLAALLLMTVAGCAATKAYDDGNRLIESGRYEEGLAQLQAAQQLEPDNIQFRITYQQRRAQVINTLLAAADSLRRSGKIGDAEKLYHQMQALDPENSGARQGLEALVAERRHRQAVTEAEVIYKKGGMTDATEAKEAVRKVLAENPRQREALALKTRIDDTLAQQRPEESKLAKAFRKPITLEFRDAGLKSVLDVIAKVSGLNFFIDKDVRPELKVTILAKNTSIADAVHLLLVTNQLEQKVLNDNSILIYPNTPQKLKDYQTLAVRTFYLANADVKGVSNTLKTILKTQDLVVDERLGLIIMRDTPEVIRMADKLVALQDLTDPEVMLELEVLEVKRAKLLELGINWPDQLTLTPISGSAAPLTLEALRHLSDATTEATVSSLVVHAHDENQDGNILANPRIRVRNKEKAQVLIGDRVPVITTTSTSTGFVSESVSYIDVGLKLEVEPNIYLDEEVAIKVNLDVSTLVREIVSKSGTLAYQIGTRSANTVLRLKDNETQILAGLINDEERVSSNKIPGLGELPILSRLFGSQKNDRQRSEIVLSITPHLVRTIRRPDLLAAEFDSGTASSIGAPSLTLSSADSDSKTDAKTDAKADAKPEAKVSAPAKATEAAVATAPLSLPLPRDAEAPVALPETKAAEAVAAVAVEDFASNANKATPPQAVNKQLEFNWRAPAEIRVGEQFSALLYISSQGPVRALPALIAFDPQVLQVANVQEGDFLKQGGARTSFNNRIDPAQGKIFLTGVRENSSGSDAGINGAGSLALVSFKAIKAGVSTKLKLLSASPDPQPLNPAVMPVEWVVRVKP